MLAAIGETNPAVKSIADLFATIPAEYRLARDLAIPRQHSESEILDRFRAFADANANGYSSFLGAGAYRHYRPVIIDSLVQRGEFLTSYTPYQPEIAQGTLQAMFEFQTMICELTGMEIANASMYDGSTGAAEAMMMAVPHHRPRSRRHRPHRPPGVPRGRRHLRAAPGDPHHRGRLCAGRPPRIWESRPRRARRRHDTARPPASSSSRPTSSGRSKMWRPSQPSPTPAARSSSSPSRRPSRSASSARPPRPTSSPWRRRSFGVPVGFGGPYCGVIACKEKFLRQMPGRLVGETKDVDGKRGYVLTLSTREQHIRREKATSNICTNQALVAMMVTIFLTVYGKGPARSRRAQPRQSHLPPQRACSYIGRLHPHPLLRLPALPRVRPRNPRLRRRDERRAPRPQDHRRSAAREVVSRTRPQRLPLVRHRTHHPHPDGLRRRSSQIHHRTRTGQIMKEPV